MDKKNQSYNGTQADRKQDKSSTMSMAAVADKTDSTHRVTINLDIHNSTLTVLLVNHYLFRVLMLLAG